MYRTYKTTPLIRTVSGHPVHHNAGSHDGGAKLTEADISVILDGLRAGIRPTELAARYGVHYTTILAIAYGKSWRHVPR